MQEGSLVFLSKHGRGVYPHQDRNPHDEIGVALNGDASWVKWLAGKIVMVMGR